MHRKSRWKVIYCLAGVLVSQTPACASVVDEESAPPMVEADTVALNGTPIWDYPSDSCDPYKAKINSALQHAYRNVTNPAFENCIHWAILSYTDAFPETLLDGLRQNMGTEIECRDLGDADGVSNTFLDHEYLELDKAFVADPDTSEASLAAVILHEVAHSKHFAHPNETPKPYEYQFAVPNQVQRCSLNVSANLDPARPNGPRRDALAQETLLAPAGWSNGNAYYLGCKDGQIASGLHVRGATYVDAVGLSCRPPGYTGYNDTTIVGGGGGVERHLTCPNGQLLVGVKGRATKWNDAIAPVCASEADVYTGKISGTVPPDTSIGGTGGLRYERHCPAYMAVRALKGKFKDYVDRIELECQRLSHLESVQTSWLTAWGGNGVPTTFEKCPGRAALVGLTYRSGTSIDQVGGQCSEITTACSGSTCVDSRATSMYQMPSRGGTGGTPGEQTCPSGKALVGLQVRSGTEIDALGAICATTTTWTNPSAACTAANGCIKVFDTTGQGGNRRDPLWCPAGQFLNGWIVGHATRVNSIQPLCRNFNP